MMTNNDCKFEYYVLNDNFNRHKIEHFNVFQNHTVNSRTNQAVRKYLRSPKNFKFQKWSDEESLYGFDAFVKTIDSIIMCEEWARCEYEIMVNGLFSDDDKAEKWDCYKQCKPNMEMIAREVIWQYKKYLKEKKGNK